MALGDSMTEPRPKFFSGYLKKLIPILCVDSMKAGYFFKICHGFADTSFQLSLVTMQVLGNEGLKEIVMKFCTDLEFVKAAMNFILACLDSWCAHFKVSVVGIFLD